jgi:hypothetical protein
MAAVADQVHEVLMVFAGLVAVLVGEVAQQPIIVPGP